MALEPLYEGMIASKNVDVNEFQDSTANLVAGRIVCLTSKSITNTAANTVYVGMRGNTLDNSTLIDMPFGLLADYREDIIASGKVSVYFTPGKYRTDQTSGVIAKGDLLTYDGYGAIMKATSGMCLVGTCTEAAGSDGMIEMALNITGAIA